MNYVDYLPDDLLFISKLLEVFELMGPAYCFLDSLSKVFVVVAVHVVDPDRIKVLKQEEVTHEWLLLQLLRRVHAASNHRFGEGLLHHEVLGNLP